MPQAYNSTSCLQVDSLHYDFGRYVTPERWNSYWHQVNEALQDKPSKILIIGVGDNIVPAIIRTKGVDVKTFDYDPDLNSDYVGDIRDIASIIQNNSFDVVICCQVLEHLDFEFFEPIVQNLIKIANKKVILSVPYNHRRFFYLSMKLPKLASIMCEIAIPTFWHKWKFDGEHFWEVGTKGYQKKRIDQIISKIAPITKCYFASAFKYHLFYVIDCNGGQ